jgi:hypothetical protein
MRKSAVVFSCLVLALSALGGCDRPRERDRDERAERPPAGPPIPAPPPAPAPRMKMVCRSSRTGLPTDCGRSDAVMVGMKPA